MPSNLVSSILSKLAGLAAPLQSFEAASEPSICTQNSLHSLCELSSSNYSENAFHQPFDVFVSLRFGEAATEGHVLKRALEHRGLRVFLCNALAGDNLMELIYDALVSARLAVIMASETYGTPTTSGFSTYEEVCNQCLHCPTNATNAFASSSHSNNACHLVSQFQYIMDPSNSKSYFVIKMAERWTHPHLRTQLAGSASLHPRWTPGERIPDGLVEALVSRLAVSGATGERVHTSEPAMMPHKAGGRGGQP